MTWRPKPVCRRLLARWTPAPSLAWRTDDVALRLSNLLFADHLSGWNVSVGLGVRLW